MQRELQMLLRAIFYVYMTSHVGFLISKVWMMERERKDGNILTLATKTVILMFSFHTTSALPGKTPEGRWNCSLPIWDDVKKHLSCNLIEECINGEDEQNCPLLTGTCEPGYFEAGGSCFKFIPTNQKMSWETAEDICHQRGSRLPSLSTWEKYTEVFKVLSTHLPTRFQGHSVFMGLRAIASLKGAMYRWMTEWADETVAYTVSYNLLNALLKEALFVSSTKGKIHTFRFIAEENVKLLCERKIHSENTLTANVSTLIDFVIQKSNRTLNTYQAPKHKYVQCSAGHVQQTFLACDVKSACWGTEHAGCTTVVTSLPPSFPCSNNREVVQYTFICDFRSDCSDESDEDFCIFPQCWEQMKHDCGNLQCFTSHERCDGREQCVNGADEKDCPHSVNLKSKTPFLIVSFQTIPPPATVNVNRYTEMYMTKSLNCSETHFSCPETGYCMPVFLICNGVFDCPGHEDEVGCDSYTCPGFYRCRASRVCVHLSHVCDGILQCPQRDDELLCNFTCPENCTCHGLAFVCTQPFPAHEFPDLRYADVANTGMTLANFKNNYFLIYLNLRNCGLKDLEHFVMSNLRILDLSSNKLISITAFHLQGLKRLQDLSLADNPLKCIFPRQNFHSTSFPTVQNLNMSRVYMQELDTSVFNIFPNLHTLTMLDSGIEKIAVEGFQSLKRLRQLDVSGNPVDIFPRNIFNGLEELQTVLADNFKLCCDATLPAGFLLKNCHAPSDEISSCEDLLVSDVYRVFLASLCLLTLVGNLSSFIYRVFINKTDSQYGYGVFVTHLCVSDFLMGVYLAMIGVADWTFRGNYLWEDLTWRKSITCKVAGVISLLSNEVSSFIVCLITLDRFLVLRFPLSRIHFRKQSAQIACIIVWLAGIVLAALPLTSFVSDGFFFSQTAICVPLPITRKIFRGQGYSLGILVVLNFVLVLLVGVGQLFIYWSIRMNSILSSQTTKRSKDTIIARRLISVVLFDFFCWFPIGLLGLLAISGWPIPSTVNIPIVIFVLPLNSMLNPFLYTMNIIHERWVRASERLEEKRILLEFKRQDRSTIYDYSTQNRESEIERRIKKQKKQ